jgi:hypothetical protein
MSQIKLVSLHCDKLQDSISEDEIVVRVNGTTVVGPIGVHKNTTVPLNATRSFNGTAVVTMVEEDPNSHEDELGTAVVTDKEAGQGNKTRAFAQAAHARYELTYSVT